MIKKLFYFVLFYYMILLLCLLINILVFIYITNLEKKDCLCSKNWKLRFIKLFASLSIILFTFTIIFRFANIKIKSTKQFLVLYNLYFILGLINIYILYIFTKNLRNCECAESRETLFFYYYSLAILIFYCLITTYILFNQL